MCFWVLLHLFGFWWSFWKLRCGRLTSIHIFRTPSCEIWVIYFWITSKIKWETTKPLCNVYLPDLVSLLSLRKLHSCTLKEHLYNVHPQEQDNIHNRIQQVLKPIRKRLWCWVWVCFILFFIRRLKSIIKNLLLRWVTNNLTFIISIKKCVFRGWSLQKCNV